MTGIKLSQATASGKVGDTKTVTVTKQPANATEELGNVTWTSSDDSIATVADGVITLVAVGTATITAKVGSFTATVKVTVNAA